MRRERDARYCRAVDQWEDRLAPLTEGLASAPVRPQVWRNIEQRIARERVAFSRPVFWCSSEAGMVYEAGDMWRIPRGTARQFDILRTPLTLNARFAVGRRNDAPILSISLLSMDLQARGQSVSKWDGTSR